MERELPVVSLSSAEAIAKIFNQHMNWGKH